MNELQRSKIVQIEQEMLAVKDKIDIPVKHYCVNEAEDKTSHGVYAREVFIPAGTAVVGKIHKYEQLNIVSKGKVAILTEFDDSPFIVEAPYTVVSPAGVKRVVVAITDVVWTTIHGTNEQDPDKLEKMFVVDTFDKYLEFTKEQQLLEGK